MQIDGVEYDIDFKKFSINSSFFVPCIHAEEAKKEMRAKMKRLGFKVGIRFVFHNGIRGLRVWRLL